jgi:hypothetical protein
MKEKVFVTIIKIVTVHKKDCFVDSFDDDGKNDC